MSNYSKHKDRAPQDTIFEIQRLLNEAGVFTTLQWVESRYPGVSSNRVQLYPTELGTNGKGTDRLYATASGYAELMERIQNNILTFRIDWPEEAGNEEFIAQPDERVMSIDEILAQDDPFMRELTKELGLIFISQKKAFLKAAAETYEHRTDGTMLTVPYAVLNENRVVWLPYIIVRELYGSNGMSAGNTIEEAMVQGISEIFERYVNKKLILGECVPPEIPDEALKPYSVWNLIEQIRSEGRYSVTGYDCSLGKGFPVTAVCITDLQRGTFCMKLGSHPSFAVSIERTLTETFQGREDLNGPTGLCSVGSEEDAHGYHNVPNVAKVGQGIYPAKLFTAEPDWEFAPWTQWEGLDNSGFLKKMLEMLEQEGFQVLVRDVSHMGFPSCHVALPGISEMYPISQTKFRSMNSINRIALSLRHFPDLTPEEERRFLRAIQFKERSILENTIGNLTLIPLRGRLMNSDKIGAFLALKCGEYAEARRFFKKLWNVTEDPEEKLYLLCLMELARYRDFGLDTEEACKVLHKMFRGDVADRVEEETRDPETMMQKVFPRLHCSHCEECELAGNECMAPQEAEVRRKLKAAMAHSTVSQNALLERLQSLISG